jgi:uncharacterized protein (DUF58 family)
MREPGREESPSDMRRGPQNKYFDPAALARLGNLQLLARTVVEGYISGLHRSPFKGFSSEFAEYREYIPGDDLKHFDWKVYARTERRFVREYEEETNMTCTVLLDASGSMGYGQGRITKFEYSCFLAAALMYLMVRQSDQVGLVLFDSAIRERVPPRGSPAHLKHLLNRMEQARPGGETGLAAPLHAIANSLKRRGLVILISDLLDEQDDVVRALQHFRHDRHELIVFNVLDRAEVEFPFEDLIEFRDLETGRRMQMRAEVVREEYLRNVNEFLDRYREDAARAGIDYQVVGTDVPFELMLAAYLNRRTRSG